MDVKLRMARKLKIFLADLFHDYRPNHICTPLGVGFIGEYVKSQYPGQIKSRLFKSPTALIEAIRSGEKPDIVGLSNYSWNVEINKLVAKRIRQECPDAVIVGGGPHVRIDLKGIEDFLRKEDFFDYYAMFEGEMPFAALVGEMLGAGKILKPDDCKKDIAGVAFLSNDRLSYLPRPTSKKGDLDIIPSPILSGALDEFLDSPYFLPLIETNRGCPFACTFCAWGISVLNKVRTFSLERVMAEIDYVAKKSRASHWYFTDANFGMLERDIEIAKALRKAEQSSEYLQRVSINWAKNSSRYCTEIAHILKGVCDPLVAVQSTDEAVLEHSKRANIKMSTILDLVEQGRRDGIAMTTDVLAGLPQETLESHLNTLRDVYAIGFESFNVGQIRMLPGSELETTESRKIHGIETKFRYIAGFFGVYDGEPCCEYEESIVKTSTMSRDDMYTLRVIHFLTWVMWNSGLAQPLLRYLFSVKNINPLDAVLSLTAGDVPESVRTLISDYKNEAGTEWFDSVDDLVGAFIRDPDGQLNNEYLKLNLKYLAKILLDRGLAEDMLSHIAKLDGSEVSRGLVSFCCERILFIEKWQLSRTVMFSEDVVKALSQVYPTVPADASNGCRFVLQEKFDRAIKHELEKFGFSEDPVRALAITLQNYGEKMMYEFAFGDEFETKGMETFLDSFDYANQLNTYAK